MRIRNSLAAATTKNTNAIMQLIPMTEIIDIEETIRVIRSKFES